MKTLYLDCGMGAAGDMLTAALLELFPLKKGDGSGISELSVTREEMVEKLNSLGIPDVEYRLESSVKCGITGSHMRVLVHGEEEETGDHHHHHDEEHGHHDHHHEEHHHDHEGHHQNDEEHSHHDHDHHHDDHACDHVGHHHHDEDYGHHDHDHNHEEHFRDHDDCHHHDHEGNHHHDEEHGHHDHDHHHDGEHHHHHSHRTLREIREVVEKLSAEDSVKADILSVYTAIAEAEGHVHGKTVEEIHFHEVGTWDAVADVAAVSLLLRTLSPDEIVVSPVHVGSGQVRCAHGILPVPAPATAYLLRDIPIYGGEIRGELCTPTGAALLRHFASAFAPMPVLRPIACGYGMGKKDFPAANCVRAILGETEGRGDQVLMLSCNIDDMTGEEIGFAVEELFRGGARDVYTTPVYMKKSRPGILLTIICAKDDKDKLLKLLFKHTTTIGVREQAVNRYTLPRRIENVDTPYGPVARKVSEGYDITRVKWEYDDIARIARETGKSIYEVRESLRQGAGETCGMSRGAFLRHTGYAGEEPEEKIVVDTGYNIAETVVDDHADDSADDFSNSPANDPDQAAMEETIKEKAEETSEKKEEKTAEGKLLQLEDNLRSIGKLAVAFSSGVDSSFLLHTAKRVLGEQVIALTAISPVFPEREQKEAAEFCKTYGIRQVEVPFDPLRIPEFSKNPADRCYHCKSALFQKLKQIAFTYGFATLAEGTNLDDLSDFRPGLRALDELDIRSPLREAGLTKEEIRSLSQAAGLSGWDKPSFACLASRFPAGEEITEEGLLRVEKAEACLSKLGLKQYRVRVHGDLARIETDPEEFARLTKPEVAKSLEAYLKTLGFRYISLDLGGYRTGNMNRISKGN